MSLHAELLVSSSPELVREVLFKNNNNKKKSQSKFNFKVSKLVEFSWGKHLYKYQDQIVNLFPLTAKD